MCFLVSMHTDTSVDTEYKLFRSIVRRIVANFINSVTSDLEVIILGKGALIPKMKHNWTKNAKTAWRSELIHMLYSACR